MIVVSSYKSNGTSNRKPAESSELDSGSIEINCIKNLSRITLNSSNELKAVNQQIQDYSSQRIDGSLDNLQTFGERSVKNLSKIESFDNFDVKGQDESYKEMYKLIVKHSKEIIKSISDTETKEKLRSLIDDP